MNTYCGPFRLPHVLSSLVLIAAVVSVGGCSGIVERRWSEEVALDDGSTIVVDRYVKFRESNSLAGDAYSATDIESTMSFRGELANLAPWSEPLQPILLFRDSVSHEWVVVATAGSCEIWGERGSPAPPYWEFRYRGGKWEQTSLSTATIGRRTNLFFDYDPPLPARKLTLAIKDHVLATNDFGKRYRTIANMKTNCTPYD